jgi:hypothetical protein
VRGAPLGEARPRGGAPSRRRAVGGPSRRRIGEVRPSRDTEAHGCARPLGEARPRGGAPSSRRAEGVLAVRGTRSRDTERNRRARRAPSRRREGEASHGGAWAVRGAPLSRRRRGAYAVRGPSRKSMGCARCAPLAVTPRRDRCVYPLAATGRRNRRARRAPSRRRGGAIAGRGALPRGDGPLTEAYCRARCAPSRRGTFAIQEGRSGRAGAESFAVPMRVAPSSFVVVEFVRLLDWPRRWRGIRPSRRVRRRAPPSRTLAAVAITRDRMRSHAAALVPPARAATEHAGAQARAKHFSRAERPSSSCRVAP